MDGFSLARDERLQTTAGPEADGAVTRGTDEAEEAEEAAEADETDRTASADAGGRVEDVSTED